jgi:hypothetical protein
MLLKKYSDFGGGKKKPDSEFLSYNLKLNSENIFCALRDKKNKNSNSRVVQKKTNFERKKTHSLRIVLGFFLLNNDDSFNALGLLKKYFWNYDFSFSYKIRTLSYIMKFVTNLARLT